MSTLSPAASNHHVTDHPVAHRRAVWVTVALLHAVALGMVLVGGLGPGVTLGVVAFAYTRGLLHALDADHLSMIDNSTRKLLRDGRPSAAVGLAFSLGHSSVVLAAGVAVVAGTHWITTAIGDTPTGRVLGIIGASVSATYLVAVALTNLPILLDRSHAESTHQHQVPRGLAAKVLLAPLGQVQHPWQVYLMGVLFGLGFDTASTVGLLMLTAAGVGASPLTLLALPLLFAAAMTLGDSINAQLMLRVYSGAQHARTANRVVVGISVASALFIASVTLAGLVSELSGRELAWAEVDTTAVAKLLLAMAVIGSLLFLLLRRRPTTITH
ncbi:hypothetical protein [Luteococcus peritonei]|uniref:Nickel/cobalt efflux system n=1 Tax=Luteococcus peritonei TaxID=88874 RepID=A0ABW4RTN1_9ACTN